MKVSRSAGLLWSNSAGPVAIQQGAGWGSGDEVRVVVERCDEVESECVEDEVREGE